MNILLVDDQVWVLSGMKNGIDWAELNMDNVYTASSVEEARRIFREKPIDILITDIEMPNENGLQLLRWVREQGYDSESICLTSHAEFAYAQEAIGLGCSEYILQPARYEKIAQTVRRVSLKRLEKLNMQRLKGLTEMQGQLIDDAADRIFARILGEPEAVLSKNIGVAEQWRKLLKLYEAEEFAQGKIVLILHKRLRFRDESWDRALIRATVKNVLREILETEERRFLTLRVGDDLMAEILLCLGELPDTEEIQTQLKQFLDFEKAYLPMDTALYYYGQLDVDVSFSRALSEIQQLIACNVMGESAVFIRSGLQEKSIIHDKARVFDTKKWKEQLLSGAGERIRQTICHYFYEAGNHLSRNTEENAVLLKKLHQSFVSAMYAVLEEKNLDYGTFFSDLADLGAILSGYDTLEHLLSAIDYVKDRLKELQDPAESQKTDLVEQAMLYVRNNLDKSLTRKEVSDYVHMNEDYLSRLVKNRTGLGLKEYILREKIELAKELLTSTSISVSLIAMKTGFTNFSHFSQSFKKAEGISPSEYREQSGMIS